MINKLLADAHLSLKMKHIKTTSPISCGNTLPEQRSIPALCLVLLALALTSCGGSPGTSTVEGATADQETNGTGSQTSTGSDNDTGTVDNTDTGIDTATDNNTGNTTPLPSNNPSQVGTPNNAGVASTTASSQIPFVDSLEQVTWPFAPQASTLELDLMNFVTMPPASSGRPARWNDMEFTGNRLFVSSEHDGRIYEITDRNVRFWFDVAGATLSSTGRSVNLDNPWHGGVRGFAFHPDFSSNGKFYVSMLQDRPANPANFNYLSDNSNVSADSVVVEWTANPSTFVVDVDSYRELFRVGIPEFDHPIKQIAFNPHALSGQGDYGLLYIAHGDGSAEGTSEAGGEGNDALGKILRINPLLSGSNSYSIPTDNPFVGNASFPDEVYSLGHRNPHHLAFLPEGQLLVTEAGHDNIEEVNLINAGANYGWSQREGAFVRILSGGLANGVSELLSNDESNGLTYPVAQVGHTGALGANFVGQSLGGGFTSNNGSALDGEFFYIDFPSSGKMFHSSVNSILASQTVGDPTQLTMAQTFEASILFDHDDNTNTASNPINMPAMLQSADSYDGSGRVDVRIGQGALGEMYLMNKRNNVIYLVRNSYPPGREIPATPAVIEASAPSNIRVNFDITVPAYMSNELQIQVAWGDRELSAGFVVDESWAISDDFPTDTENTLIVNFNDRNGDITLGSYDTVLRTGMNASETITISAAQFDTDRWDDDSDGASNLDELSQGLDPLVSNLVVAPLYSQVQTNVFNGCDGCHNRFGGSGGLSLHQSNSYTELVNAPSNRQEGAILVIPFDPDNSYLLQKMEGADGITGRSMSAGTAGNRRVRDWIAGGALNN